MNFHYLRSQHNDRLVKTAECAAMLLFLSLGAMVALAPAWGQAPGIHQSQNGHLDNTVRSNPPSARIAFQQDQALAGFDDTGETSDADTGPKVPRTPWLLVPWKLSNTVMAERLGTWTTGMIADITDDNLDIHVDDNLTVVGTRLRLTVRSTAPPEAARNQASYFEAHVLADVGAPTPTTTNGQAGILHVYVKPTREIKVHFYLVTVHLNDGTSHTTERSAADMDAYLQALNDIWGPQANVHFVKDSANGTGGVDTFTLNVSASTVDPHALVTQFVGPTFTPRAAGAWNVYFVWNAIPAAGVRVPDYTNYEFKNKPGAGFIAIEPKTNPLSVFSIRSVTVMCDHPNHGSNGYTVANAASQQHSALAHEAGHAMGFSGNLPVNVNGRIVTILCLLHSNDSKNLMYSEMNVAANGATNRQIPKYEVDVVNSFLTYQNPLQ